MFIVTWLQRIADSSDHIGILKKILNKKLNSNSPKALWRVSSKLFGINVR